MTNRAIRELAAFFVALFIVLAIRQIYIALIEAPRIAQRADNPRHALLDAGRGRILAGDGTVLAQTAGGRREYPLGASLAALVGYDSTRYGASGIEAAFDRALSPPDASGDAIAQLQELERNLARIDRAAPRGRRDYDDRPRHSSAVVRCARTLFARGRRRDGSADGCGAGDRERSELRSQRLRRASFPRCAATPPLRCSTARSTASIRPDRRSRSSRPPRRSTATRSQWIRISTIRDIFEIGDFTLHDNESEATGYGDLTTAFALSSNVDFAQIALKMGTDTFYSYLDRWGIGASLDFQLPAESTRVPPKAGIVPGELAQMGFGQGALLVSPLQMALIGATIANGGAEPRPYVVRQIVRDGVPASVSATGTLANPVSTDTAAKVTKMMIAVVERGTGTPAQIPHVTVAGKTGTATNPLGRSHSWFVCFAPAEHPRVAVAIVVENVGYGATYAAPIAKDVMETALQSIGNSGS